MYDCGTLYEYYVEYEFGIGGNKAVKNFTKIERRNNKFKICRRKKLIDAVKYLIQHTPPTVSCNRLESVYGFNEGKSACLRRIGIDLKATPRLGKYFAKYPLSGGVM